MVWAKASTDDDWVKAKVEKVEETIVNKQKGFAIGVLFQDSSGQLNGQRGIINTNFVDQSSSEFELIKLRNQNDEVSSENVDDLVVLSYLHEPAILWSIYQRFRHDIIYTNTGPILLAINPFKNLSMYSMEKVAAYRHAGEGGIDKANSMKPHVFKVADGAYRNMSRCIFETRTKADQAILVSGESGAGKTETTKFIMRYLADITKDSSASHNADNQFGVEHLVLQSNPILESFGNARTLRNDNSSRFGKFIEINFAADNSGKELLSIQKATIRTYLLEKVRLVHQSDGERNYHCFYEYLLGSPLEEREKRGLTRIEDYKYLTKSRCIARKDGVDDEIQHKEVVTALQDLEFTESEQSFIADIVAAVLHIGNIMFCRDMDVANVTGEECRVDGASLYHAEQICSLLKVDLSSLQKALCEKEIFTREGVIIKKLSIAEADSARDSLSKTVYGALFDWLVFKVNHSIQSRSSLIINSSNALSTGKNAKLSLGKRNISSAFIGVLDIFGFENFDYNSFEQLCINFTNETLQQHFNQFVFEYEQSLYEKEGINWSFVAFPDNKETLDLLDNRQKGIFSICDDQGRLGRTTLSSLVSRLYDTFAQHPRFSANSKEKARNLFVLHHYAGPVCYDAQQFLEKNNDTVSQDMIKLLRSSAEPLLLGLLPYLKVEEQSSGGSSNNKAQTLGFQFRTQLRDLMQNISSTTPHYIRCIKPNPVNQSNQFDQKLVVSQLRCCGVIEAVRVSRAGFPNRYKFLEFLQRYACLTRKEQDFLALWKSSQTADIKTLSEQLAERLAPLVIQDSNFKMPINLASSASSTNQLVLSGVQVGVSMVFLRRNTFDVLELLRFSLLRASAIVIQARLRCLKFQKVYRLLRRSVKKVQCWIRVRFAKRVMRWLRETKASIILQTKVRSWLCRRQYHKQYRSVILVQSLIRRFRGKKISNGLRRIRNQIRIAARWKWYVVILCSVLLRYYFILLFCFSLYSFIARRFYLRFVSTISTLQRRLRMKCAKRLLGQMKIEAKSLQKVMTERDLLAQRLRELEEKYKLLEQEKAQQATVSLPVSPAPGITSSVPEVPPNSLSVTPLAVRHPMTPSRPPADLSLQFSPIVAPALGASLESTTSPLNTPQNASSVAGHVREIARHSIDSSNSLSPTNDEVVVSAQEFDRMRFELEESKRLLALYRQSQDQKKDAVDSGGSSAVTAQENDISPPTSPLVMESEVSATTVLPNKRNVLSTRRGTPTQTSSTTGGSSPAAPTVSNGSNSSLQMAQFAKFKQKIEKLEQENQRLKHKVSRASVAGLDIDEDEELLNEIGKDFFSPNRDRSDGDDESKRWSGRIPIDDTFIKAHQLLGRASIASSGSSDPDFVEFSNPLSRSKASWTIGSKSPAIEAIKSGSSPAPAAVSSPAVSTPPASSAPTKKPVTEVMASRRPMTTLQRSMSEIRITTASPNIVTGNPTNPNVIEGENPMKRRTLPRRENEKILVPEERLSRSSSLVDVQPIVITEAPVIETISTEIPAAVTIPVDYGGDIDLEDSDNEDPNEEVHLIHDEDIGNQDFQQQDQKQAWEDYQRSFASRAVSSDGPPPSFLPDQLTGMTKRADEEVTKVATTRRDILESDDDSDAEIVSRGFPSTIGSQSHLAAGDATQRKTSIFRHDAMIDSDDEVDVEVVPKAPVIVKKAPSEFFHHEYEDDDDDDDESTYSTRFHNANDLDLSRSSKFVHNPPSVTLLPPVLQQLVTDDPIRRRISNGIPTGKGEFYNESDDEDDTERDDDLQRSAGGHGRARVMFQEHPSLIQNEAGVLGQGEVGTTDIDDDADSLYPASRASTVDGEDASAGFAQALLNTDFSKLLFGDITLQLLSCIQGHRLAELQDVFASSSSQPVENLLQQPLDAHGRCSLHWAVIIDDLDILQYLLALISESKSTTALNVNILDYREQIPLHYARSASAVEMLVSAGAEVDHTSAVGQTSLHRALYHLYTANVNPATTTASSVAMNNNSYNTAAFNSRVMMTSEAVDIDADIADYYYCFHRNAVMIPILTEDNPATTENLHHRSVWLGVIRSLLRLGADPMFPDPLHYQRHSLHFAAIHADFELLQLIFADAQYTLNVDFGDEQENTPILFTVASESQLGGQMKIFSWLVSQNASALLCNEQGLTALHLVCANRYLSELGYAELMVDMLLGMSADPNALDPEGCTPLIVACTFREWTLCKLLLEAGGDMNIPCSMNSVFLQGGGSAAVVIFGPTTTTTGAASQRNLEMSKDRQDQQTMALMKRIDCTASDLMPRQPRYTLFGSIRRRQTRIPGESRDCCMNCGNEFHHGSSSFSMFRVMTSGKHHCRHCHRVVCQSCSPKEIARDKFPPFVQEEYADSYLRICVVCNDVLFGDGSG